jgi:Domain of unknown function (DUF3387)
LSICHPGGRVRGEETGLRDEEIAFYDALAENESARQVMGEPALRVIAAELVASVKGNVTVDWMHREAALVKRLLRKYAGLAGRAESSATCRGVVGRLGGVSLCPASRYPLRLEHRGQGFLSAE